MEKLTFSDFIVFFFSFFSCCLILFRSQISQRQMNLKRIHQISYNANQLYAQQEGSSPPFLRKTLEAIILAFRNLSLSQINEIKQTLASAGFSSKDGVALYLLAKVVGVILQGFLTLILIFGIKLFQGDWVSQLCLVAFGGAAGFKAVDFILNRIAKKRKSSIERGVPDMLSMMVICSDAGLGMDATIERVARELRPINKPLAQELSITSLELTLMPDRRQVLNNLTYRTKVKSIGTLMTAFLQAEKYGSALGATLRDLAAELRQEQMMAAEAKAARLPATLTIPLVLFILPCLFIVILGPVAINL
jgi:tight adherence protein C